MSVCWFVRVYDRLFVCPLCPCLRVRLFVRPRVRSFDILTNRVFVPSFVCSFACLRVKRSRDGEKTGWDQPSGEERKRPEKRKRIGSKEKSEGWSEADRNREKGNAEERNRVDGT